MEKFIIWISGVCFGFMLRHLTQIYSDYKFREKMKRFMRHIESIENFTGEKVSSERFKREAENWGMGDFCEK